MDKTVARTVVGLLFALLSPLLGAATAPPASSPELTMLMAGHYDELDSRLQAVQDSYRQHAISDEQLLAAFRPFYEIDPAQEPHFDEWVRRKPKSYVARLARGIHYKYVGLKARGGEFIDKTSAAQLLAMDEAFRKAVLDLRISVGLDGAPLLSYLHSMDIGRNLGLKQFDRDLLQAANRIDPHNFIVRRKYFYMLQTRWGGSVQEMKDELEDIRRHGASAEHLRELEIAVMEDQAWAYAYRDGDYQAAEREYEQILALQPDYYAALDGRVWVLVKMQRYGEVVEAATRILERLPNDPDAHYFRGYAYMKQNKATDALADYRVAANVGHAEAQAQLGRTYWHGDTGVPKDHVAALSWMRKAAAQGNEGAQRDLECALKEEK